jgi:protein-S-isoprenylcysteine O-methyltransferase Ste14
MATFRYFLGVLLVVTVPPAVVWWFVVHPFVDFWRRMGPTWALIVVGTLMGASMVGLWHLRRPLVGRDLGAHWFLVAPGVALLLVSFYLGLRRRKQLTTKILSGVPELQEDGKGGELLTEGLYARIRHPRYVEVTVGVLGYAALANHLGAWIVTGIMIPTLHLVVLLEERELARRFGAEYEAYRGRVPRYVPRWRGA